MIGLKTFWGGIRDYISGDRRLNSLYQEREKLREVCIPYKIQPYEGGYLDRQEIIEGRKRLAEIDKKIRRNY